MIPGVVGFLCGGLWWLFFITFSIHPYVRTFLRKTHHNPPQPKPTTGIFPPRGRFSGPGRGGWAAAGMVAHLDYLERFFQVRTAHQVSRFSGEVRR